MIQNLIGRKFGNLTVKETSDEFSFFEGNGWVCLCDCGQTKAFSGNSLIGNVSTNCGCIKSNKRKLTDQEDNQDSFGVELGLDVDTCAVCNDGKDLERRVWKELLDACYDKSNSRYRTYGGKGITVCERWRGSFENFFEDMGPMPSSNHKLVRAHFVKIYEKHNCRWVPIAVKGTVSRKGNQYEYKGKLYTILQLAQTPEAKIRNLTRSDLHSRIVACGWTVERAMEVHIGACGRKTTHHVTHNGVTKSIVEWAIEYKIPYTTLYTRLIQHGWDFERAVSEPRKLERTYTHNGITKTISEWAKQYNKNYNRFYIRLLKYNWSFERVINTP